MKLIAFITLLLLGTSAWAATKNIAGYVGETTGGVAFAFNKLGEKRKLDAKAPVYEGETLITSKTANSSVIFTDGTTVELNPSTQFRVEEFRFGETEEKPSAVFRMLKGGFRFISGLVNKSNGGKLAFKTATATIGVRGSAGYFDEKGTIEVYEGTFDVAPASGGKSTSLSQGQTANTASGSVKRTLKLTKAQIQSKVENLKDIQSALKGTIAGIKAIFGSSATSLEQREKDVAEQIKKAEDLLNLPSVQSGGGGETSTDTNTAASCAEGERVVDGVCVAADSAGGGDTDTETSSPATETSES